MKKYKFNEEKFLRNITILSTVVTVSILVVKVATQGISWMSTIGYLG